MSTTTASKADRRRIADEFKEREVPRGIFAVRLRHYRRKVGQLFAEPLCRSELAMVSASHRQLSQHRPAAGMEAARRSRILFEVLEKFEDDISPLLLNDLYTTKKREWATALNSNLL